MDLDALTRALADGDEAEFAHLLCFVPDDELAGPRGTELLETAARAGRAEAVEELVLLRGVDVSRPWTDGVDAVGWAAERGLVDVLRSLLSGTGKELVLHRRALRAARAALAADPTGPEARRAVISMLEFDLGLFRSPDGLMARALVHADPDHPDWDEALLVLARRADRELVDWACARVLDAPSLAARRFALDALFYLGLGINFLDDGDEGNGGPDFTHAAVAFLRPLLDTEQDPYALKTVLYALREHCWRDHRATLPHLGHVDATVRSAAVNAAAGALLPPTTEWDQELVAALLHRAEDQDPTVRRVTAEVFVNALAHRDDVDPRILAAVLHLADDPAPDVRAAATHALYRSRQDTPALRAVLTRRLDDSGVVIDIRIQAAGALAARGDQRGRAVLDGISRGFTNHRSPGDGTMGDVRHMLRTYGVPNGW
ncbi:HEAT repeat domain-containing protein [Kitasatospora sp. cg17-2]